MKSKSPIVLKFNNLKDKLNFESEREAYYINQIRLINQGKWFPVWLKSHFTKEGRSLANKYDNYVGGYWIDEDTGYIYTNDPVELYKYPQVGDIIIQVYDEGYQSKIYSIPHDTKGFVQIK